MAEAPSREVLTQSITEFWQNPRGAGRLIVRAAHFGHSATVINGLCSALREAAASCEPPLILSDDSIEVQKYSGNPYGFGAEATVPEGTVVPTDIPRISQTPKIAV